MASDPANIDLILTLIFIAFLGLAGRTLLKLAQVTAKLEELAAELEKAVREKKEEEEREE